MLDWKARPVEEGMRSRILPSAEVVAAAQAKELLKLASEGLLHEQLKKRPCKI